MPLDSSSKNVYVAVPDRLGVVLLGEDLAGLSSTWPGAALSLNVLCLPPSCQMILPVRRLTL